MSAARGAHPQRSDPERLLTVIDLARAAGVEAHVVRFYARRGLIRPARHAPNGYRQFAPFDVHRVSFVRAAQSLGFTLGEIGEILRRSRARKAPCALVRDIIVRRLAESRDRLGHLQALLDRMQHASKIWRRMPDQMPTGDVICALIEAVAGEAAAAKSPSTRLFPR